jgi:O-antigen/teichoic acid export membrane protein
MDESKKERFRWRFYSLSIILNLIVLLIAIAVFSAFRAPPALAAPIVLILVVISIVLFFYFIRSYRAAREWLNENT